MRYIYSTLTCDNKYAHWAKSGDQQSIVHSVLIKGGAGLMDKNFLTPFGVVTEVSDEDHDFLMQNAAFLAHKENGFITIEEKKIDVEKAAANMKRRDKSSPIVPSDYEKGGMMDGVKEPTVTGGA